MSSASADSTEQQTGSGTDSGRLRITEIFRSLQGESTFVGLPTTFVRLTGCPLRCQYCDTTYAFFGGHWNSIEEIVAKVRELGTRHVCVTGGEPLAQKACLPLLSRLCDEGHVVSLETSGAIDISLVDPRVVRVIDVKTPGSGEVARNRWDNLTQLHAHDEIKFVICGRDDYDWARDIVEQHRLIGRCGILFSPSHAQLPVRDLADWIVADCLPVRFQVQLHKILWGDQPGR